MANGSDFLGIGLMGGGLAVGAAGFLGKTATAIPQFGMSDGHLMIAGGAAFALGAFMTATSGSKSLF